ncbi:MAG: DUF6364 family protein [Acidobacteriia bacterium]|nr:DUF6364 family protein [Terriglobia bacterium]
MSKNVTLRLDDAVLRKARHAAVEQDQSLSEWVAGLVTRATSETDRNQSARASALLRMRKGLHLGGTPLSREDAHGR